ncbi:MAG: S8 family peptidase [Lentisphaeria bacterium]|jgi:hypothetical protein
MTTREQRRLWALWALCAALSLALIHLHYRADRQNTQRAEAVGDTQGDEPSTDNDDASATASAKPNLQDVTAAPRRGRAISAADNGSYVFTTRDASALAALRRSMAAAGLQEIGSIETLRMLRVAGGGDALAGLLARLPDGVSVEKDRVVWLPEQNVAAWTGYAGMPFRDTLLSSMGIDRERGDRGDAVLIALLDTPLLAHVSLDGAKIAGLDLFGVSGEGAYAGHATAVASLLVGQSAELPGIAPAASLLSIPVMSGEGAGSAFQVAEAIIAAVSAGADIISMSLGTYDDSAALRAAVAYAQEHGVVLIAAAGNDGLAQVTYPAAYEQVIAVAAVDARWTHAGFSNRGAAVDIAAPGVGIYAAGSDGSGSEAFSGTSAAVPCVSGALACVLSADAALSAQDAMALLLAYSNDNGAAGADALYGEGVLAYDRVVEREQPGIYDAAAAGHAAQYEAVTAGYLPIQVSAQNRGTEPLPKLLLSVTLAGRETVFTFNDVQPGQVVADVISLDLELMQSGRTLLLESRVETPGIEDSKPGNETRRSVISMPVSTDTSGGD